MRSQIKVLLLTCLIGGGFAICSSTLADSINTNSDAWGIIQYTHWPTKVMYGPGHQHFAVMQTTSPNQRIKVDFLRNGWYAVFKPTETKRDKSTIIGYVPASSVYPQPLTNAHPGIGDNIDFDPPPDHAKLIQDAISLANHERYDEAVEAAGTALASARKTLGSKHPDVAACLETLGDVYNAGQQYSIARDLYEQALIIDELSGGTNSLVVASDLNNIAMCHYHLKEYKEAEALFDKSLAMFIEFTGEHSKATTQILRNMMALYRVTNRPELAAECEAQVNINFRLGLVIVNTSPRGTGYSDRLGRDRHILEPELRRIEGVIRSQFGGVNPYTPPEWE